MTSTCGGGIRTSRRACHGAPGGGDWTPRSTSAPNKPPVFGFGSSRTDGSFLRPSARARRAGRRTSSPSFRVDPSGVWGQSASVSTTPPGRTERWRKVSEAICSWPPALKTVRHFHGRTWSTETTRTSRDGQFRVAAQDGSHVLLIGVQGGVARAGTGSGTGCSRRHKRARHPGGLGTVAGRSLPGQRKRPAHRHTRNGQGTFVDDPPNTTALLMGMGFGRSTGSSGDGAIPHAG